MVLPIANIFTGAQDAHSEREWSRVEQDMAFAAATIVELAGLGGGANEELRSTGSP